MNEDLEVLKQHIEALGLEDDVSCINALKPKDWDALTESLLAADEDALGNYVKGLPSFGEFQELIQIVMEDT